MNMDVVINTCYSYYEKTLDIIVHSLLISGIRPNNIHIVVGDAPCFITKKWNDTEVGLYFVPYMNIDENGLLWIGLHATQLQKYIFYLHDTTKVCKDFLQTCDICIQRLEDEHSDGAKLRKHQSMCIGFYRASIFKDALVQDYLRSRINLDENRKIEMKTSCEDQLFNLLEKNNYNITILPNANVNDSIIERHMNIYGTRMVRYTEYYEIPGVFKYKTGKYEFEL